MKKLIITLLSIIIIPLALAWVSIKFYPEKIAPYLLSRQLKANRNNSNSFYEENAITVVTVGTATPLPGERAQTGTAVFVNGYFFMFDVGAGVVQKSENLGLPLTELDGIFLTHYHSDHMMDLPNMISRTWVMGRKKELHVYGPDSLNKIVKAANSFLKIENQYRVDHHGSDIMDISIAKGIPHQYSIEQNSTHVVFQKDDITVTAFDVNHSPIEPAVGYVIEYNGKKIVLSGDTKKNELLEEMAKNCDLLIHEVMLMSFQKMLEEELANAGVERNAKIIHDIQDYHTSTVEVAALAQRANAKKLVLNHLAPAPDNIFIKNMYLNELKGFDGPVHLANDGDKFIIK
jgi:ribonuclease Z